MRVIFILLGALFLGLAILSGMYGLLLLAYGYPANHPAPIVRVEAELLALALTAIALGLACVLGGRAVPRRLAVAPDRRSHGKRRLRRGVGVQHVGGHAQLVAERAGRALTAARRRSTRPARIGWVTVDHCCSEMKFQVDRRCEDHPDPFDCPDNIVVQVREGSYGLPIHDGGSSWFQIRFCPWCGQQLPGDESEPPGRRIDVTP